MSLFHFQKGEVEPPRAEEGKRFLSSPSHTADSPLPFLFSFGSVIQRFKPKSSLDEYNTVTLLDRLRSAGFQTEALLTLYHYMLLCLALGGGDKFRDVCRQPKSFQVMTESVDTLAGILKVERRGIESPVIWISWLPFYL